MKFFLVVFGLAIHCFPCRAQDSNPFSFSFSLSPNSTGSIDGQISMALHWKDWVKSGLDISLTNNLESFRSSNTSGMVTSSSKQIDLGIISINQNLLWVMLKQKFNMFKFSIGFTYRAAMIDSWENGFISNVSNSLYAENRTTTYLRPLVSFSAGIHSAGFRFDFEGLVTPIVTYDTTIGDIVTSMDPVLRPFMTSGIGSDNQFIGSIRISTKIISPMLFFKYSNHDGLTITNRLGSEEVYVFNNHEYNIGLNLILDFVPLGSGAPWIGIAWNTNANNVASNPDLSTENSKINFNIGLQL